MRTVALALAGTAMLAGLVYLFSFRVAEAASAAQTAAAGQLLTLAAAGASRTPSFTPSPSATPTQTATATKVAPTETRKVKEDEGSCGPNGCPP